MAKVVVTLEMVDSDYGFSDSVTELKSYAPAAEPVPSAALGDGHLIKLIIDNGPAIFDLVSRFAKLFGAKTA